MTVLRSATVTVGPSDTVTLLPSEIVPVGSSDTGPVGLAQVLAAREARAARQAALLAQLSKDGVAGPGCVVSATVVTPGPAKRRPWVPPVFLAAVAGVRRELAERGFPIRAEQIAAALPTGPEALWSVAAPDRAVKAALVALEDGHPVGRLWDLDVLALDASGDVRPLARTDFGGDARRCLLCDEPAAACARSRRHDLSELVATARAHADRWEATTVGPHARLAHACLVAEVWHTPKPGLVDRRNTGSHDDMDVPLFEASAAAITPALGECELVGRRAARAGRPLASELPALRRAGVAAEARMFDATGGVNTHRGAIFAFGLLCAAAGWLDGARLPVTPTGVCALVAQVAPPMPRVAASEPPPTTWSTDTPAQSGGTLSHGLAAYAAYGMTGARGAAASGYAVVREHALPAYERTLRETGQEEAALAQALLELLARNEDTNLAARGGRPAVAAVRARAAALLSAGGATAPDHAAAMRAFDDDLIAAHLSPGGSADLLGVTRFLAHLPRVR